MGNAHGENKFTMKYRQQDKQHTWIEIRFIYYLRYQSRPRVMLDCHQVFPDLSKVLKCTRNCENIYISETKIGCWLNVKVSLLWPLQLLTRWRGLLRPKHFRRRKLVLRTWKWVWMTWIWVTNIQKFHVSRLISKNNQTRLQWLQFYSSP